MAESEGVVGGEGQEEAQKPIAIQLVISFDPQTGGINVNGPINNKILCYGMLAMAQDAISKHRIEPLVKPAKGGIINFLRNGNK